MAGENHDFAGRRNERPPSHSHPPKSAVSVEGHELRDDSIKLRIARIMNRSTEVTFVELVSALGVSRPTATRWLASLESDGLVRRSYSLSGQRGRPKLVYYPTKNLLNLASAPNAGSNTVLDFAALRNACRHLSAGLCSFGETLVPCLQESCPILSNRGF